jgi:glycyl-tRNA synthetase (class II)
VTVRERDSMKQERVSVDRILQYLRDEFGKA